MNQKGFNLFSIIVAAVLLMIGTVLISTLISTEDTTSTEIYLMTNNFSLSDAASLARSDALQSFNYNFREQLETYLTYNDYELENEPGFALLNTEMLDGGAFGGYDLEWDRVTQEFERVILLTGNEFDEEIADADALAGNEDYELNSNKKFSAAIRLVAEKTINQFNDGRYGKYYVSISDRSQEAINNTQRALTEAISPAAGETINEPFLQVVGCDSDECPIGTFYFNIPLSKISDASYEKLPRIIVKDLITNEEMKIAILPRSNLKIYIPLRFFKAIFEAEKNLELLKGAEDSGYFSDARLGFCDPGCTPRSDPLARANGPWNNGEGCVGVNAGDVTQSTPDYAGVDDYATKGALVGSVALNAYSKAELCGRAGETSVHTSGTYSFLNYNYNEIDPNPIGLVPSGGTPNPISNCPFFDITTATKGHESKTLGGTITGELYCGQIKNVYANVVFKETNPLYIVTGTGPGEDIFYKIKIRTKYYPDISPAGGTCNNSQQACTPA